MGSQAPGEGCQKSGDVMRAIRFILGTDPRAADTSSPAAIIRFVVLAAVLYAFFCWLEPRMLETYRSWYRWFGNAVFADNVGSVHFFDISDHDPRGEVDAAVDRLVRRALPPDQHPPQPIKLPARVKLPTGEGEKDTLLLLQNRQKPGELGFLRSGSRLMGYAPTVLLISLVLVTPVGWMRRAFLLIAGLVLLHAFIAFRLWIFVLHGGLADPAKKWHLYSPSAFWSDAIRRADNVLVDDPTFNYVIPIVMWIILLIVLSIWSTWRERRAECGVGWLQMPDAKAAGKLRCPQCGKRNRPAASFCRSCGANLVAGPQYP